MNDYANAFINGDYKTKFKTLIDDLFARAKRGEPELADRSKRMKLVEDLTEAYITQTGERPDHAQLDRLATLILREELTDKDRMKMRKNEYPIMSDEQLARRQEGKHKRDEDGIYVEVPLSVANNIGIDGRDYGLPKRRKRSEREIEKIERNLR
jgi:hypothetical protein